jgi:hypothetical protein
MSRDPDWLLIRRIIRIVTERGGLHRADLAAELSLPAYGESMQTALAIAWKLRKIDFCGQYVVTPGTFRKPATTEGTRP